jgi:hypothetical protein
VPARRIPWLYAAVGAIAYVVVGLWLADRLPTWSEEVSLQPNHGYRVLPDDVPAGEADPGALPVPPWCGGVMSRAYDGSGRETGGPRWILSSARPVLTVCIEGRAWPVLTMPYASGVFAWPMWLFQPLHHDDVFVQRKIGLVRGLLALGLLFVMVRALCPGEGGRLTAGVACLLAGASAPFVYPHVLLFPYETLPWTLVASAFWVWSRCPELKLGAEPLAKRHPSNRKLLGGAMLAGLALLANVKAAFLFVPLLALALRRGASLRRVSRLQWIAMAGIFVLACSPIWIFALVDPAAGLSQQLAWRAQIVVHKLRPGAFAAELVNLCTFGSDLGFYFEQVAGKPGTHFGVGIVAVAVPIAYAWVACVAHVAGRPVGSSLAAACGAILAAYFCVSWLLYDQVPAANYSPLHCVFGATYAAFCTDAAAALAKLPAAGRVRLSQGGATLLLTLPLALILLWATLRRGDPVRTLTSSLNVRAERDAARYLLEHPEAHGELMTTSYNLAGVLDSLGHEALHPIQAHLFLGRCAGRSDATTASCVEDRLRWLLGHRAVVPLRVLVPAVVTAVDGPADVGRALPAALKAAAAKLGLGEFTEARFRSGDGTEVLWLLRVDSEAQLEAAAPPESTGGPPGQPAASAGTLRLESTAAEVLGLREGEPLGPLVIAGFRPMTEGRLPVLVRSGKAEGQLEVALRGGGRVPVASSERYSVYWDQSTSLSYEALSQAAAALAERLKSTEATASPPAGMLTFGSRAGSER